VLRPNVSQPIFTMELNQIAVPGVYLLILFLGYPSQILFYYLDPAPLTKNELVVSNVLLIFIFITYTQSIFVDPGQISKTNSQENERVDVVAVKIGDGLRRTKWCRKCDAAKPARAHHCKECKRYHYRLFFFFLKDPLHLDRCVSGICLLLS